MSKGRSGIVVVAGPTASGKSALALRLAQAFRGTVINSDSMQLYSELRLLTARPGAEEEALAPHRLYGLWPAAERGSAARWCALAQAEIAAALAADRLPILVGGTGLYLRALLEGLAPVPDVPPAVRTLVKQRHAELGQAGFYAEFARRDPVMAARLVPGDSQRLIRAAEVLAATGRSLAEWQREQLAPPLGRPAAILCLMPERAGLYAGCDARFRRMIEQGALDEVAALARQALSPDLPAMKALGVPALLRHLAGEITLEAAILAAQGATRRYAKRQGTWFRHQITASLVINQQFSERILPDIFSFIRQFLLTATA